MEREDGDHLEWFRFGEREPPGLHPLELGSAAPGKGGRASRRRPELRFGRATRALSEPVLSAVVGAALTLGIVGGATRCEVPGSGPVFERVVAPTIRDLAAGDQQLAVARAVVAVRAATPTGERLGSGVVFRAEGYILTNSHLVDGATAIQVAVSDGRASAARDIGSDPESDLAILLAPDVAPIQAAPFGSSRDLKVGQSAMVVGATGGPGATPWVSAGVISGLGEVVRAADHALYDVVSTDATIGPRATGGPLVDTSGRVVGITTGPTADGLGLVVPIDLARRVAEAVSSGGRPSYPWLGVSGRDLVRPMTQGYRVGGGVLIQTVAPKSPADQSGLKAGDVVTNIDGIPISSMDALTMLVRRHEFSERAEVTLLRSGTVRKVSVRLTPPPPRP